MTIILNEELVERRRGKLTEGDLDASIRANRECWDGDDGDDTRVCDAGHKAVMVACGVAAVIVIALVAAGALQ